MTTTDPVLPTVSSATWEEHHHHRKGTICVLANAKASGRFCFIRKTKLKMKTHKPILLFVFIFLI